MNSNVAGDFPYSDHMYSELPQDENGSNSFMDSNPSSEKVCPVCKKVLPPDANMSFHLVLHPWTEKPYACDHCLYVSLTREELSEHCKQFHPPNRKFICAVCKREFTNVRTLNKHKPTHALVLPFSCAYCDKGFPEYGCWRQHEVAHKTARFQCTNCTVRFTTQRFYNDHVEKEDCKNKVLQCCDQDFATRMLYVEHCFRCHRFQKKDEHECKFCGRLYAFKCLLQIHMQHCRLRENKSTSDKSVHSPDVNGDAVENGFSDAVQSQEPNVIHEMPAIQEANTNIRKEYKCDICDRSYLTKSWLMEHRQKHLDPNYSKHICSVCNTKYKSYSALYYHKQRVHLKIRRYKCTHCEKAFYDPQSLKNHVTIHTGEQPYACDYCPMKFRTRGSKIDHHRIHTGERPYHCRYCEQSFKRRDAKRSHERRHTGEKPYKCRICDRGFAQDSTWRSHERKHQPPFACTLCESVFTSKDDLVSHKENHNDETVEQVSYAFGDWNQPVEMSTDAEGNVYIQYRME